MEFEELKTHRKLTVNGSIRKAQLQRHTYTISLMNEAVRAGLLTTQDLMRIQQALLRMLQELIRKYTQGESSSVPTDTAESILSSMMYALDAYLFSFDEPEKALTYLKASDIRRLYDNGVERVRKCFDETKQLYFDIAASKLNVPVDAYNMTLDESIPIFLRKYGILFDAHNTMASIDYPLAVDDMQLQGVYYLKQYLERLKLETEFCHLFDEQELLELLIQYGRECRFNYRIELFNIFELVLHNAVFSVLSVGEAGSVRISEGQYHRLEQLFTGMDETKIRSVITDGMRRLEQELLIQHESLKQYMGWTIENFVQRVMNAAKHGSLRSVIITWIEREANSIVLSLDEEDRMSDVSLRRLLQEIAACTRAEEKVEQIISRFHSLHDYLDLLESDILYGEEYVTLFDTFGDSELAILAKIVFYEELRSEAMDISSILDMNKEYSAQWQMHYDQYLNGLSVDRLKAIEQCMQGIDYEQITFY